MPPRWKRSARLRGARKVGTGVRVEMEEMWYPYFMRRLAERPANVFFLMSNLFK